MLISNVAINKRTTVFVLGMLIIVSGVYSYFTLPREAAPDVPIPFVLVNTIYEGVSPEDVESAVTIKIENELTGIKGVKEITSSSAEGMSLINIEFQPDIRIEDALQYVRDKVDVAKADLPAEAEEPTIREVNVAEFPVIILNISGDISPVRLKAIADALEDEIEQVPGVLNVDVMGAREREIRLEIDPDRVAAYQLTIPELINLIPGQNVNISAGALETPGTKFNVRVPAEFIKAAEVENLPLTTRNGKTIYLLDVARVSDTFKDRMSYSRLNGAESISLNIRKAVGANIIELSDTVKAILAEARQLVPAGVKLEITTDMSDEIREMISDLENNVVTGLILVVAVLVAFMGWRTSIIVALAIPLSMLISFFVLDGLGYTLNMIVLFSLILALGMLVDNAIVIVENIFRHRQMGYGRMEAAMKGTAEVAWPVTTSTATTIAAFSPLLMWPGIMGDFMKYLPATLIITLSSSLFVALVISPTVCSLLSGKVRELGHNHPFILAYRSLLGLALKHRVVTLSGAFILLATVGVLYGKFGHGVELFPDIDPRRALVNIRSAQGTNIVESDRLAQLVEGRLEPFMDDIKYVITNVGSPGGGMSFVGRAGGPHVANLTIVFHDYVNRKRPSADVVTEIRKALAGIPGPDIKVEKEREGPPTGAAVAVRIMGKDFKTLDELAKRAKKIIADVPGLVNLRSDLEAARPELVFRVDRDRANELGVSPQVIGNFLKTCIFGRKVSIYRQFNDEYDITVRLPEEHRREIQDLRRLNVPNIRGQAVPLKSLGKFEYSGGLGTVNRVDQKRVVTLSGDAEGRLDTAVLADVRERLEQLDLPAGYKIRYAGQQEEQEKASRFLFLQALPLALLLIVLILVAQFNTLSAPLIIMTTVVLSFIGVLTGLLVCLMPFGIVMTGVGVISLAGVVVNNAIVLLDYTRQLQSQGMDIVAATLQAGATRLRPVLLTAITTILGLVPMATGVSFNFHNLSMAWRSESSQWWSSMAVAVIFGLAFATVLTLVVVPTLYASLYQFAARFGLGGLGKREDESEDLPRPVPAGK